MENISYEDATKELNIIISKLEGGSITLDEAVACVERGKELIKLCYQSLSHAKGKLTELKDSLGKLEEI